MHAWAQPRRRRGRRRAHLSLCGLRHQRTPSMPALRRPCAGCAGRRGARAAIPGKVRRTRARRGGQRAVAWRGVPWLDWQSCWAIGYAASRGRTARPYRRQRTRHRRRAHGSRGPAHRAHQVRPVRQQRHVRGLRERPRRRGGPALEGLARDAARRRGIRSTRRRAETGPSYRPGQQVRFRHLTGICNDVGIL